MASLYIFNDLVVLCICNNRKFSYVTCLRRYVLAPMYILCPGQWVTLEVIHSYAKGCNT
jgi:hypothetical protein